MSNSNLASTLPRPVVTPPRPASSIAFCLAQYPQDADVICTRLENHDGHCCDEVTRQAWDSRGKAKICIAADYDHSKEKGLVRA
jgi:hypothetical protein